MADFLCILSRNLKLLATGLGWWENSDFFLVTPEVYVQPWLAHHKDYLLFFQDTLVAIWSCGTVFSCQQTSKPCKDPVGKYGSGQ